MRIAVIGSGISGLTCAYLLNKKFHVDLFEAQDRLGGHTHTHDIKRESGNYRVDTGFIVHNDRNYPHFTKLMKMLKVETEDSNMSFSVKAEASGLEYNGTSLNSLFAQRKNLLSPTFYRMIRDILRFNQEATKLFLERGEQLSHDLKLETYLLDEGYSEQFIENYIMPMGAAIWSASREEMRQFPLKFFIRFFHHHGMLTVNDRPQWRVIKGGSDTYIKKMLPELAKNIYLSTPVTSIKRKNDGVMINGIHQYDHVILASHADQSLKMLEDASEDEKRVLSAFEYRPNQISLHTDSAVLPQKKLAHASWNYFLPKKIASAVNVTYHMNILQNIKANENFLVSLNMDEHIKSEAVIKKVDYDHPVYHVKAAKAQTQHHDISGKKFKTHFCGAYWGNGFHEDGVVSALKVCQEFGVSLDEI